MSQSDKFNAETSLRMAEKAVQKLREYLASGDKNKANDAEWFARNAHKSAAALKNSQ